MHQVLLLMHQHSTLNRILHEIFCPFHQKTSRWVIGQHGARPSTRIRAHPRLWKHRAVPGQSNEGKLHILRSQSLQRACQVTGLLRPSAAHKRNESTHRGRSGTRVPGSCPNSCSFCTAQLLLALLSWIGPTLLQLRTPAASAVDQAKPSETTPPTLTSMRRLLLCRDATVLQMLRLREEIWNTARH